MTNVQSESQSTKLDWLLESCNLKTRPIVKKLIQESTSFEEALLGMAKLFPKLENDLTLRTKLDKIQSLPQISEPAMVAKPFLEMEELMGKMSKVSMSDQEKFILLTKKIHPKTFQEMRSDRFFKRRTETYQDLKSALLEKVEEDWQERHLVQLKKETVHAIQEEETSMPMPRTQVFNQGKGKGKCKGKGGTYQQGKGFNNKRISNDPPNFKSSITCNHCGKRGHYESKFWNKFPELKPPRTVRDVPKKKPEKAPERPNKDQSEQADANPKKRKAEVLSLKGMTMSIPAHVQGLPIEAIIDTGATISVVAKNCVEDNYIMKSQSIPIEVGSGETIYTLGTTEIILVLGEKAIKHKMHVLETSAFQAVLGMDFLNGPRCTGIATFPNPGKNHS